MRQAARPPSTRLLQCGSSTSQSSWMATEGSHRSRTCRFPTGRSETRPFTVCLRSVRYGRSKYGIGASTRGHSDGAQTLSKYDENCGFPSPFFIFFLSLLSLFSCFGICVSIQLYQLVPRGRRASAHGASHASRKESKFAFVRNAGLRWLCDATLSVKEGEWKSLQPAPLAF